MNFTRRRPRSGEPKGIVMLLSLFVLSAITAVAVGMALVIMKDVEASSNIDRSLTAYYATESGIEFGLNAVKDARLNGTSLADLLTELVGSNGLPFDNGARWSLGNSTTNEEYTLTFLRKNTTVVLDLYNPDSPAEGGFESFWVEALDAHPDQNPAWLEVSYFPWMINPGGQLVWNDDQVTKRLRSIYETPPDFPASFNLLGNSNYRVRVKALYDDLKNVRIAAYDVDNPYDTQTNPQCNPITNCLKPIPNRVLLRSTGFSGDNQVGLSASVPWQIPAAGFFDYVLFSEQQLDKRT